MEKKFWIDFSGYLVINAEDEKDAQGKFWDWVNSISASKDFSDDVWDIEHVEQVEEFY